METENKPITIASPALDFALKRPRHNCAARQVDGLRLNGVLVEVITDAPSGLSLFLVNTLKRQVRIVSFCPYCHLTPDSYAGFTRSVASDSIRRLYEDLRSAPRYENDRTAARVRADLLRLAAAAERDYAALVNK